MNKYPKYKKSGIDWIGNIPEHWKVTKLRFLSTIDTGAKNTEDRVDDGLYPFFVRSQTIERINSYSFDGEAVLTAGDGVGVAKVFHHYNGKFDLHQRVYKMSNFNNINGRYFYYYFQANLFNEVLRWNAKSTVDSLRRIMFQNFPVTYPATLPEQTAIADFLDKKTALIDSFIEKKKKLIELLKEERTAIINQAVTRGLNQNLQNSRINRMKSKKNNTSYSENSANPENPDSDNVKLKPSGIEWLGDIPEHWEVKKLKYSDYTVMGQSPSSDDYNYSGFGFPFIQGNAEFTEIYPEPKLWCDTANKIAEINDILVSVRAPIGAVNIANQKIGIGRGLCAIRAIHDNFKFLYYIFLNLKDDLNSIGTGSTYTAISSEEVKNILLIKPPFSEQTAIANFLDKNIALINSSIRKIEKEKELMQEYRTALINEVVTGKVKIIEN